ncbi:YHR151C [Saccharomyces arboricola H-6]|uniref:Maintenance of telomere capping protein 6 n=1 Tax=Saccharomyces arboricola (strain H-6 / AS 2.3317 / CBS 10644) TaxID=1160507 RepID=J8Q702_SACAR|nr:YHR151C [Saccharomyces arboricola H-6]
MWILIYLFAIWSSLRTLVTASDVVATTETVSTSVWPSLSPQMTVAFRSQRDVMGNMTIDQLPYVGLNLRRVLLNNETSMINEGNNTRLLALIKSILASEATAFVLDLKQQNDTLMVVDSTLLFSDILTTFQSFISSTQNNLYANVIVLLLNVSGPVGAQDNQNQALNTTYLLDKNLGSSYIYKPTDLQSDRSKNNTWNVYGKSSIDGWPTLGSVLYEQKKRLVVGELTDFFNQTTAPYIFPHDVFHYEQGNSTLDCTSSVDDLTNLSSIHWRFLDSQFNSADIKNYISCGLSPILRNPSYINNVTQLSDILHEGSVWSWDINQPSVTQSTSKSDNSLKAYNCVLLHYFANNGTATWRVDNCYGSNVGLCRYENMAFEWLVRSNKASYFDFDSYQGSKCPDQYTFNIPRTPLEQKSLISYLKNASFPDTKIWIDLNSVSVSNCWVSGGPYATCPYEKVISTRNFVTMMVPASVCSFALLCIVVYLSVLRVPIYDNRKNWRRVINKISKSELEGVPS